MKKLQTFLTYDDSKSLRTQQNVLVLKRSHCHPCSQMVAIQRTLNEKVKGQECKNKLLSLGSHL